MSIYKFAPKYYKKVNLLELIYLFFLRKKVEYVIDRKECKSTELLFFLLW